MRNKVLAGEIGEIIAAEAKPRWKDLGWEPQYQRIEALQEKYKCNRYTPGDDSKPRIQRENDGSVSFLLGWAAIGDVDAGKAKAFIGQLNNALSRLRKAADELKKEYPDVVIKGL